MSTPTTPWVTTMKILALCMLVALAVAAQAAWSPLQTTGFLPTDGTKDRLSFLQWFWSIVGWGLPDSTVQEEPELTPAQNCTACKCGVSSKKKIVGGSLVQQVNQYPWMALLMYNRRFYCGATVINSRYLLTAAHCVKGFTSSRIRARLMEHDRSSTNESKTIDFGVERVLMHKSYDEYTFDNDIAILRLDGDIPVMPICMAPPNSSFTGLQGLVTGWGVTKQGGSPSQQLREVTVPIMAQSDCRKTAYGSRRITDNMMCAGFKEGGKDSCQGDSGGPLKIHNDTRYHIVGVVSWGEGCAQANHPGVYTRVNRYLTWINKNTQDVCTCSE